LVNDIYTSIDLLLLSNVNRVQCCSSQDITMQHMMPNPCFTDGLHFLF